MIVFLYLQHISLPTGFAVNSHVQLEPFVIIFSSKMEEKEESETSKND